MNSKKNFFFIILIIILHLTYAILFLLKFSTILTIAIIAGGIIQLSLYFLLIKNRTVSKFDKEMFLKTKELQKTTDKLLTVFFKYFDNSFLLVRGLFRENKILLNQDAKELENYLNNLADNNGISEYLEEIQYKEKTKPIKNTNEIFTDIDNTKNHAENLISMVNGVMTELFEDNQQRLNAYVKKDTLQKHLVEYQYYSELVCDFLHAIVNNISDTSKPMSEEIYQIKKNVNMFLINLSSWKNELTSEKSGKDFGNVINNYSLQNDEFQRTFKQIDENYKKLEVDLEKINETISRISNNSSHIQDIAEKTKVLSINASIESARAGIYGKGFKIISGEISKMSEDTQNFVHEIVDKIADARKISSTTISEFSTGINNIINRIDKQRKDFETIYNLLQNFYKDFNNIFDTVSKFIGDVNTNINKFNPIFQLHDISIQQMENITRIIKHFLLEKDHHRPDLIHSSLKSTGSSLNQEILNHIVEDIEQRITTDLEIELLNKFSQKYGLAKRIKLKAKSEGEVEFF